jgi:exosortase
MSVAIQIARLERKADRWPRLFLFLAVVLFAGCFGPWLYTHFSHLWQREHYQFFPMMLVAVAGLSYGCWTNAEQQGQSLNTLKLSIPLLVLSVLTFAGAIWLNSPWLAFLTTIIILWTVLRNIPFGTSSIAPLIVLLPLPFAMDGEVVHGLQRISSRGASALLDLASIPHLMSGNVLEVSDKNFFVEEACSGIGSVYLLLASAAIYASWRQLRLIVTIPLLLSAVFWAVAGNTFRIFSVAWAHENLQLDLSSGSLHDLLGSATYLMSLLLLIMTEQALLFAFDPLQVPAQEKRSTPKIETLVNTLAAFWDQRTRMDPELRIQKFLERGLSGYRVTRGAFVLVLLFFFSLGSVANLWWFWPDLTAIASTGVSGGHLFAADESGSLAAQVPILKPQPEVPESVNGLHFESQALATTTSSQQAESNLFIKSDDTFRSLMPSPSRTSTELMPAIMASSLQRPERNLILRALLQPGRTSE